MTYALLVGPAYPRAQAANPTQKLVSGEQHKVPVFRATVVARTTPAINYRHRGGATKVDFRGPALMPGARGDAKIKSKRGYTAIDVELDELEAATKFGPEYLTFVMWAITPEGRATNLGEVVLRGNGGKLNVTTELQAFGLVVTAEPYFAVSQPSDVVVMENVVRSDTEGAVEHITANYELLKRGTYLMDVDPSSYHVTRLDSDTPLDLYQARNAVELARLAGADRYSAEAHQKATTLLDQAERLHDGDASDKSVATLARKAVQTAEDARLIALQRYEQKLVERAREEEAQRRLAAEARRAEAVEAAERARIEADRVRERLAAEQAAAAAERAALRAEATAAREAAERIERDRTELRERLERQLDIILETRESARGLIVNMPDVLFDTGQHALKPGAREKLAKVAGILQTYPGLLVQVEGHTDSVGDDAYNQALSDRRATAVRDYLIAQGVPFDTIMSRGYGEALPLVSNDTAAGRQQNRRVELVVSGEAIGRRTQGW